MKAAFVTALTVAGLLVRGPVAWAQDQPGPATSGNFLSGDWGGVRSSLRENGVNVDFTFTQFVQTISGEKADTFDDYPNRFDLLLNVDTDKAGLWNGGGIGAHIGTRFGGPPTGIAVYPANTALIAPTTGEGRVVVTSLYLTQRLGTRSSITFGKIDMLDLLAAAPFMGGRGIDGFMHIAFAGPPSGVAPVTTYGAIFSKRFDDYALTFLVFDPQDQTGWHAPFAEGINFSPSFVIPRKTFGHNETHTFAGTFSTQAGTDLADLPQVILPPEERQIGVKRGPFNLNYTYERYFFQNPRNPADGWGMFAKFAIADGNPNTLQNTLEIGIGGSGLFANRSNDRFGVGYFSLGLSDTLKDFLQPLFPVRRERGMEAFYSFAVMRWLRVTADVQVLPATIVGEDTKVFGALRTKISL
jgi:porin